MTAINFEPWPKIPRLNRDMTITEKLDGTNAAVLILPLSEVDHITHEDGRVELFANDAANVTAIIGGHVVLAQSRNRFIVPGKDNYGFAAWVHENAQALVVTLGVGRHFGEWWGPGVQRGYGLTERRFSLFNVNRWTPEDVSDVPGLDVVPVLYRGAFEQAAIDEQVERLRTFGSVAAKGFPRPEGIVVFHAASRSTFKVTLEGDAAPKGEAGHALDEERSAA